MALARPLLRLRPELQQVPREPHGIFSDEGRRKLASMIVWGRNEDAHYDRLQIQARIERVARRIAKNIERGKYRASSLGGEDRRRVSG